MSVSLRELSPGPVPLCRLFPVKLELVTEAKSGCSGGSATELGSDPGGGPSEQDSSRPQAGPRSGLGEGKKREGEGRERRGGLRLV